jgi:hypothetical protein
MELLCRELPPHTVMAFNDDGVKRPIRRGGQRQTRSAGTPTLFHATGPMQEHQSVDRDDPAQWIQRPTRLADGPGNARKGFVDKSTHFVDNGTTAQVTVASASHGFRQDIPGSYGRRGGHSSLRRPRPAGTA